MIPIFEAKVAHIDVTNACNHTCANCTRFVGHHKKPYFMELGMIEKALESYQGFPGNIGLMGGEPAIHPKFREICKLFQKYIPDKNRRQFWTSGLNWDKYEDIIKETFNTEMIVYNDHKDEDEGWHQPLLIASGEIMEDKELMWKLIDDCWIQKRWSPAVTQKGAFFCEVAGALDMVFDGPGGWPVEKDWWNKTPEQFQDQVKRYCPMCSAAIPLEIPSSHEEVELVSPGNLERLKKAGSPKALANHVKLYDKKYTRADYERLSKAWKPGQFRNFIQHEPGKKIYRDKKDGGCASCAGCNE